MKYLLVILILFISCGGSFYLDTYCGFDGQSIYWLIGNVGGQLMTMAFCIGKP